MIASFLFAVIVIGLVAMNWDLFIANVTRLGPVLVGLNILMLALAWIIARGTGMEANLQRPLAEPASKCNSRYHDRCWPMGQLGRWDIT